MKIYLVMRAFVSPHAAGACSFALAAYFFEGEARARIVDEDRREPGAVPSRIHWLESVELFDSPKGKS